ncbi:hypothetical protein QJS10_CPA03g00021 [Acorus calamus]|uniref:Late embryogenesis abundant protein LEA-2 subgroup domain-containing protein n=1 Tax=Acorus calamus TaxID=4465 RepID=A0AAV9F7B4_ACOCL|nr:hypothetical protein QJS10_CPA03g00021 [Acorus calamus]
MTEEEEEGTKPNPLRRHRRLCVFLILLLLLTLFIICLILALTLFKPKDPDTRAGSLATDVLSGGVGFDINTRLPGRVNFLGIIKRQAVAVTECHIVVGFPRLKVQSQECKSRTKI